MNWDAMIGAAITGVVALTVAAVGYRRSKKVDGAAERSGVASDTRADLAQLIDALQKDNSTHRARIDALESIVDELRRELARLRRKYGDNGITPPKGTPTTPPTT